MKPFSRSNKPYYYILVRSWNAFDYFDKCINSILNQTYKNYKILYIDDASDYTLSQKNYIKKKLKGHVAHFNNQRMFSVYNALYMIKNYAKINNSMITVVDADDWLIDNNTLKFISDSYIKNNIYLTYGSCMLWDGFKYLSIKHHPKYNMLNRPYSSKVIKNISFRREQFRIFHPVSFSKIIFNLIKEDSYKEDVNTWLRYSFDLATYIPILEMINGKFTLINKTMAIYNISSPNTNDKRNLFDFLREDLIIRKKEKYEAIF